MIIDKIRIWHNGLNREMKIGTYSENEIKFADKNCIHQCNGEIIEVFFFQGGYYHKMQECIKCGGFVSSDMLTHPKGRHEFNIKMQEGTKCRYCELILLGGPVILI